MLIFIPSSLRLVVEFQNLSLRLRGRKGAAHCSAALRGVHMHDCHNALTMLMQPAAGGGVPEPGPEAAGAQGGARSGGCQRRPQGSAPYRHHGPLRRRCVVFSPVVPLSAHLLVAAFGCCNSWVSSSLSGAARHNATIGSSGASAPSSILLRCSIAPTMCRWRPQGGSPYCHHGATCAVRPQNGPVLLLDSQTRTAEQWPGE